MIRSTSGRYSSPCALSLRTSSSAAIKAAPSKAKIPVLISRIRNSSSVASPGAFVSTTRSIVPSGARTTRPYPLGSSSTAVASVAAAPDRACACASPASVAAVISG
jgi:hypothetical protein